MAGAYSLSVAQGRPAGKHDRREYTPRNADRRLAQYNNIMLDVANEQEWFNELFSDSITAYNAKQARNDRKKGNDYFTEIQNSANGEKPFYEYVIQIGNRDTNGVTTSDFDEKAWKADKEHYDIAKVMNNSKERLELKAILDEEMSHLQERYPNFRFCSIIGHDDEPNGTYHYHVRFTPVGTGYKKGMPVRCSLRKALDDMGFHGEDGLLPIKEWQNDVKDRLTQAMEQKGYSRHFMSNKEQRLELEAFKREMHLQELEEAADAVFDNEILPALEDADVERYLARMDAQDEIAEAQIEAGLRIAQAEKKEEQADRFESEVVDWAKSQKREIDRKNQVASDKVTETDGLLLEAQHLVDGLKNPPEDDISLTEFAKRCFNSAGVSIYDKYIAERDRRVVKPRQEKVDAIKQRNNAVNTAMRQAEDAKRRQQSADLSL